MLLVAFSAGSALAQPGPRDRGPGGLKVPGKMIQGGDRRTAGEPRDARRPERMSPEDREKLRRDIDDANRRMERRR